MINYQAVIRSQYLAALAMLEQAITKCPGPLWADSGYYAPFWHVAYHALFYTHLYLQPREADLIRWEKFRADHHVMGPVPWENNRVPEIGEPYSQADLLDYVALCRQQIEQHVPMLDLAAPSGFGWIPMNKLELQFYNIRHLQQHTGELMERLGSHAGVSVDWIGMEGW